MQAHAGALPIAIERVAEPRWRQAVGRSVQNRLDVRGFNKCEVGRDANPPYDYGGAVVVASAWLAFYVIAALHHLIASGN